MKMLKVILQAICIALVCSFAVIAHAEDLEPYYFWEVKNYEAYRPYYLLFSAQNNEKGIIGSRDEIYRAAFYGRYSAAAYLCEWAEANQKIAFGADYMDENLTELTAKLYLMADELDKAERKINLLADKAQDNQIKIRALNLKAELLNRKGNYQEALKVSEEAAEILRGNPDEKLNLINQARAAKAYCGLGETKKSLELAEKIFPQMQAAFGEAGIETLAVMTTIAEDYHKTQRYKDCEKILMNKVYVVEKRYVQNNPVLAAQTGFELVDIGFVPNEPAYGEGRILDYALRYAEKCAVEGNNYSSLQICKKLNEIAPKHLGEDNSIVFKATVSLARMESIMGNVPQSIEICKKNLPHFKKVLGEGSEETLALMKILSDNYLLLGKYSDAKKIIDETLTICKKNLGEHAAPTVAAAIDLANISYRTGKYKTGDKLLADIQEQSRDLLQSNPRLNYDFVKAKTIGARMTGAYVEAFKFFGELESARNNLPSNDTNALDWTLEQIKLYSTTGVFDKLAGYELTLLNFGKICLREYSPIILEMMSLTAESQMALGELKSAERFTEQLLKLSREHFGENNLYEWKALNTLSKIRRAEGNSAAALELDKKALQIAEKVCGKNSLERFQTLNSLASDYSDTGNFAEAIKIREKTLSDYKKVQEDSDEATTQMMTNLAENYIAAKKYSDAIKLCDEILAKQKISGFDNEVAPYPNIIELFRIKATAQKLSGDNVNADANYKKLIQRYELKRTFPEGFLSTKKWFAGVVPVYKDAAAVAASEKIVDTNFAFYCVEFSKGRSLIDRYDDVLVAKNYLLSTGERNRLNDYQKLLTAANDVAASAINDDTLKANAEMIHFFLTLGNDGYKGSLRKKYSNNMVPKDPQKRAEAEQKLTSWEETLKNFDIKKNRQAIPNGACFVEFMKVSDDSLLAMFLRNDSEVSAINIPVDKDFFDKCRLYHELNSYADINSLHSDGKYLWQISDGKYAITTGRTAPAQGAAAINNSAKWSDLRKEISKELSQKLIPNVEKFVGNSSHWIISPDAELNLLPFETLVYNDKMLIESVDISYVPSLAVLNLMKERERKNAYLGRSKELFAMGDAVYGDSDTATSRGSQLNFFDKLRSNTDDKIDISSLQWSNLPGTARELDKVSTLFDSKDIFRRGQATEKNLQNLNIDGELSKYKYLLFATHGLFVPDMPEISSIVLSQDYKDDEADGYVTVSEWMGYDLRSNLIYLSACESGLGGYQAGEGIVGIPYALTVAGNKDTVMSLWKVDDEATAEFTAAVFEKLSRGQSEVAALNATKREFINKNSKYSNPSVWAAFLLYGI